jgi:hypothetical protein
MTYDNLISRQISFRQIPLMFFLSPQKPEQNFPTSFLLPPQPSRVIAELRRKTVEHLKTYDIAGKELFLQALRLMRAEMTKRYGQVCVSVCVGVWADGCWCFVEISGIRRTLGLMLSIADRTMDRSLHSSVIIQETQDLGRTDMISTIRVSVCLWVLGSRD